ncbi:hypothetical protein CFP56_038605 [Quercus suber]|uniref:Uncharacterized protein n=1 Tax=Quercus suber TaxID=58331 RepID=A0AAW0LNG0_QUESU
MNVSGSLKLKLYKGNLDGIVLGGQAANMFTPGAVISGLITSCPTKLGPLDENAAITGAILP